MRSITDEVTVERFGEVVADFEAKKVALHPEQPK
jgi:hypothetical protein